MKKILGLIFITFIAVLMHFTFGHLFHQMELVTYDARAKWAIDSTATIKKFKHLDKNIVIVSEDDFSKNELAKHPNSDPGAWPWRRDVWGKVVNFIEEGHPKAILFDIVFSDVNENSNSDYRFARILRQYDNIVLSMPLSDPSGIMNSQKVQDNQFLPTNQPLNVINNNNKIDKSITFYSHAPVHEIYSKYHMMAVINKVEDGDTVIRSVQPIYKLVSNGQVYYLPSLAFSGFLKYMGDDSTVTINGNNLFYKGYKIPLSNKGRTLISWHGLPHSYPFIHVSDILLNSRTKGELTPEYFKDKIVIIGRTEAGTDIHPTSVSSSYPGPEANATAIDNFIHDSSVNSSLARKFVTKLPRNTEMLIVAGFCFIIAIFCFFSKNAIFAFLNTFMLIMFYLFMGYFLFINPSVRIWIPLAVPLYYMILTSGVVYALRINREASKKDEIVNMFGKFVSPNVLHTILKESNKLTISSTKKHITTFFCDVKDFTRLSEKTEPQRLLADLNELFNEVVNIIFENNGTVDKFVGDCVMAYWGEPIATDDDEFNAVKSALEIKKKVDEMKLESLKNGKTVLDVKIGINTGDALLGLSGSDKIMSYTAMGDAVNIASRLEGACTKLKRDILISKSTYEKIKDRVVVLDAGKIDLKGKTERLDIYEPIGLIEPNQNDSSKNLKK